MACISAALSLSLLLMLLFAPHIESWSNVPSRFITKAFKLFYYHALFQKKKKKHDPKIKSSVSGEGRGGGNQSQVSEGSSSLLLLLNTCFNFITFCRYEPVYLQGDGHMVEQDFLEAMSHFNLLANPTSDTSQNLIRQNTVLALDGGMHHFYLLHGPPNRT